jgi:hypothetical protein
MFKPEDNINPQEILPVQPEATAELSSEGIIATPEQFESFRAENEQNVQNETGSFVERGEQALSSGLSSLGIPNFSSALETGKQLLEPIKKKALGLAISFGAKLAGLGVGGTIASSILGGGLNQSESAPPTDPIMAIEQKAPEPSIINPETSMLFSDNIESSGLLGNIPHETNLEKSSLFGGVSRNNQEPVKIEPLHVTDPNDPNNIAYLDSLTQSQKTQKWLHEEKILPPFKYEQGIPQNEKVIDVNYYNNKENKPIGFFKSHHKDSTSEVSFIPNYAAPKRKVIVDQPEGHAEEKDFKRHLVNAKDWEDLNTQNYGEEEMKVRNADPDKFDVYRLPGNKFEIIPKHKKTKIEQTQRLVVKSDPLPSSENVVTTPEVQSPETYTMFDGKHYSYDDLVKAYPALKDPKVFEINFHKKPPNGN